MLHTQRYADGLERAARLFACVQPQPGCSPAVKRELALSIVRADAQQAAGAPFCSHHCFCVLLVCRFNSGWGKLES